MSYASMIKEKEFHKKFGFTGVYCGYHQEYRQGSGLCGADAVKEEKKRPEFKGYKTRIKREKDGVSLYIEHRYFTDKAKRELQEYIDGHEARKAQAFAKYQEELEKLDRQLEEHVQRLASLE